MIQKKKGDSEKCKKAMPFPVFEAIFLMTDAVVLTTYQGFVLRSEFFDHRDRIQSIEPEPEEE